MPGRNLSARDSYSPDGNMTSTPRRHNSGRHVQRSLRSSLATRFPSLPEFPDRLILWAGVWTLVIGLAAAIGLYGPSWLSSPAVSQAQAPRITSAGPVAPPVQLCGNGSVLGQGPITVPRGAVEVPAGDDSAVNWSRPGTTYWFAAGVHTLGAGQYTQIVPGRGSTYVGAPGAVLNGKGYNNIAFGGDVPDVTIEYLTIENFNPPGNQGAVNASAAPGWTVKYDTIRDIVPGTAVYAGTDNVLEHNCLTNNGQSGFGTYTVNDTNSLTGGASNIVVNDNEISYNDTCNWEAAKNFPGPTPPRACEKAGEYDGCGCSAGGKFWQTDGGQFEDNYVHDNYSAGIWWDTNNVGFDIRGNYFSGNYADGVIYEISYNALIQDNTFIRNGLGAGEALPGFPTGAIFVSESGSDRRVPGNYRTSFLIADNTFTDNWDGVVLWENSNRFCNSPANTSSGVCTLVDPSVVTLKSCVAADIGSQPYYGDCRWKTQNVLVTHNFFDFNPANIGAACTVQNECGLQGLFSEYGTYPSWSPYQGDVVSTHITLDQNNHFTANVYHGPWNFMLRNQGSIVSWEQWQASPYDQDQDSVNG
jgi:hypothetical protein